MNYPPERSVASIKSRVAARIIDLFVVFLLVLSGALLAPLTAPFHWGLFLLALAYFLGSDALPNGQSLGKKLLRIRVIDAVTQRKCTIGQSAARAIVLHVVSLFELFALFADGTQRFGDRLANTFVIRITPLPPPLPSPPLRPTKLCLQKIRGDSGPS